MNPTLLKLLGLFAILLPASNSFAVPPNLLFIMTDDQAPWAVGISGNEQAITPNLDALFRSGAYLKNAYTVTPVCSPSRAALLTSLYGSEVGITDWINLKAEPGLGLKPETPAWPRLLAQAGYKTGLVGKWHLGDEDVQHPTVFGYQTFLGFRGGGTSVHNPRLEKDRQLQDFKGQTVDILTDEAVAFMRKNATQPFVLSLHYRAPHAPWLPVKEEDGAPYKDREMQLPQPDYPGLDVEKTKRMMREYLSSVRGVDRNVGRLLQSLNEMKLADHTIVIFTSDHGYNLGHNGIWHKGNGHWALVESPAGTKNVPRGQRPNMYDNSLRVPTAVVWPGVIEPGTIINATVTNLDWFPTLLAMAGVERPADIKIRGRNIVPVLKGTAPSDWNNDLYAEYSTHHQSHTHMRAYRTERWKLVRDFLNPERDELFDLDADPAETTNLITSDASEVKSAIEMLQAKLIASMKATDDKLLEGK